MSASLFFQLLACAVSLAGYMFGMETNLSLSMDFFACVFGLAGFIATTFVYCLFSEYITHDLSAIGGIFYGVAWYQLSLEQQQLFRLPLQRANKIYRLTGCGLVPCSLDSFASVRSLTGENRKIVLVDEVKFRTFFL